MATASASSIRQFDCDPLIEALGPNWKAWVNRLEQYFKSIKLTDDTQQVNSLFFYAGEGVSTLHESLKDEVVPNSETTAKFVFEEIICKLGMPRAIISDKGVNFFRANWSKSCVWY